jgi:hypothetical protein
MLLAPALALASGCASYTEAELTGKLVSDTFAGPPNYESIEAGDAKETYFFLSLSPPICVAKGQSDSALEPAQDGVVSVQLVLNGKSTYESLRPFLGKTITCRGSLFASHTGHHHAPVLMWEASCR